MPEGHLCCTNNGKYQKWYHVTNNIYTYIPKKQKRLAEQLAIKKYLTTLLEDLSKEKEALQFYIKNSSAASNAQILLQQSEYRTLLQSYFQPASQETSDWLKTPYEHNTSIPGKNLIITYETSNHPLDLYTIEKILQVYFL